MNRKLFFLLTAALMLVSSIVFAEQNKGAADIRIFAGDKGDVPFPHLKHQTALVDCNKCHNLFPQTTASIQEYQKNGKLKKKQVMDQCRECHRIMAEAGQKTGPTSCAKCHQK